MNVRCVHHLSGILNCQVWEMVGEKLPPPKPRSMAYCETHGVSLNHQYEPKAMQMHNLFLFAHDCRIVFK